MTFTPALSKPAPQVSASGTVVSPAEMKATLTAIWRREFGPKGGNGDGHVLHAKIGIARLIRFLAAAETEIGVVIPPGVMMRLGTIDAVVAAIGRGAWPEPSPLALLRDGRPDQPVYVVSTGGGHILEQCDFALAMEHPGQIWALHLPGLDGEAEPYQNTADMGRHYADAVARQHPAGVPVNLIGYSFAGLVVSEMTAVLTAHGLPLGLVAILDSGCFEKFWTRTEWLKFGVKRAGKRLQEIRALPPREAVRTFVSKAAALGHHVLRRVRGTAEAGTTTTQSIFYVGGLPPDIQRVRDGAVVAFETCRPARMEASVTLFKSEQGGPRNCDPVAIWKPRARGLTVVMVPGNHTTMIRLPHARVLAREVSSRFVF